MYRRNQQVPVSELARFAGSRLVSMSEIREADSFNETLIKQFTGGDMVTARYLYQNAFEYRPQLKLWIGTNHDPDAKDEALWRRLKKIPFRRSIPYADRNKDLKAILRDEDLGGKAVLAWAVRGAMEWYKNGLQEPASVTMEVAAYRQDQDRFGQFITDCLDYSPGHVVPLNDMYETYKMWCKVTNEMPKRQPQFIKSMDARGVKHNRNDQAKVEFRDYVPRMMHFNDTGVIWS
jgi:putative DNA primase/helicase